MNNLIDVVLICPLTFHARWLFVSLLAKICHPGRSELLFIAPYRVHVFMCVSCPFVHCAVRDCGVGTGVIIEWDGTLDVCAGPGRTVGTDWLGWYSHGVKLTEYMVAFQRWKYSAYSVNWHTDRLSGTHPTDAAIKKVNAGIKFVMAVAIDDDPRCRPW